MIDPFDSLLLGFLIGWVIATCLVAAYWRGRERAARREVGRALITAERVTTSKQLLEQQLQASELELQLLRRQRTQWWTTTPTSVPPLPASLLPKGQLDVFAEPTVRYGPPSGLGGKKPLPFGYNVGRYNISGGTTGVTGVPYATGVSSLGSTGPPWQPITDVTGVNVPARSDHRHGVQP